MNARTILIAGPRTDEEMTFRTYRGYLEAVRMAINASCPSASDLMAGVANAVNTGRWRSCTPTGRSLSARAGRFLRNAWATEVLLNSARRVGGDDLITFANHWAPVQAYYAVFEALNAVTLVVTGNAPKTHGAMLRWTADQIASSSSPFPAPWTCRATGAPHSYGFAGFPAGWIPSRVSNIATPSNGTCWDHIFLALKTTRKRQIEEHRPRWLRELQTKSGASRKRLPKSTALQRASAMRPTTLFDLLYRLRIRSNYQDADAFLRGALTPADAAAFHQALGDVVAATLLVLEIYLSHQVGKSALEDQLTALNMPSVFAKDSAEARRTHW